MSARCYDPHGLRGVAEQLLTELDVKEALWEYNREDYLTSLVRQWMTYDGKATLFTRMGQLRFVLGEPGAGELPVTWQAPTDRWAESIADEFNVPEENLPAVLDRLNIAQRTEVINTKGHLVELEVNPETGARAMEDPRLEKVPADGKVDTDWVARDLVRRKVGQWLEQAEEDALVSSVLRQWQRYDGQAMLFLAEQKMTFTLAPGDEAHCNVGVKLYRQDLGPWLCFQGLEPGTVPDVLHKMNLGEEVSFRNRAGNPYILYAAPWLGKLVARPAHGPAPSRPSSLSALFCPCCSAVLAFSQPGDGSQTCPQCGLCISP